MIGIINAESAKIKTGKDGEIYMVLQVSPESRYNAKQIRDEAKRLQKKLVIRVEKYRNKRSLNQNRLMWALLEIMATAMSGRAGDVTAWAGMWPATPAIRWNNAGALRGKVRVFLLPARCA